MTTPGAALQSSARAGAEAGGGAADTTTVACDLVRVGIFFDGTGNSRDHVGTRHIDSWHSNVDLLERLYKDTDAAVTAKVNGSEIQAMFGHEYIRGVGIEVDGGNQQWGIPRGTALGTGPEGVAARTRVGIETARQLIREKASGLEPCFVWIDTFGFSRGACVARDFANDVKDGMVTHAGRTAEVKFMGIWDTVSSIGFQGVGEPSNMGNFPDEGVRINTNNTAEHIVHITAKDELRANFPLTLAMGGKRIEMVGAHSDIGGGYAPGTDRGSVGYSSGSNDPFFETVKAKWDLEWGEWDSGWGARGRETQTVNGDKLSRLQTSAGYSMQDMTFFNWQAEHGLQFVSLAIMHDQAVAKDVPFNDLGNSIEGISVGIDPDLRAYYEQLKNYPHRSDINTELRIRRKYTHMSVQNSVGMGPEPRGTRRVGTM